MDSGSYIGVGLCIGVLAGLSGAIAVDGGGGSIAWLIAIILVVIAQVMVSVGCIGLGVKVGIRDSGVSLRSAR